MSAVRRIAPAFILGLALGAAAGSWGQRAAFHRAMRNDSDHRRSALERLTRELSLNENQKSAVAAVVNSRMTEVDRLKAETFARLESIRKSTDAELVKVLTPEQATKLDAMHRSRRMRVNWQAPEPAPSR